MNSYPSPTGGVNLTNITGADHYNLTVVSGAGATVYNVTLAVTAGAVSFATGLAAGTYTATATPIANGVNGQATLFTLVIGAAPPSHSFAFSPPVLSLLTGSILGSALATEYVYVQVQAINPDGTTFDPTSLTINMAVVPQGTAPVFLPATWEMGASGATYAAILYDAQAVGAGAFDVYVQVMDAPQNLPYLAGRVFFQ